MPKPPHTIHDHTFHALMEQRVFVEHLLKQHVPQAILKKVNWSSLKLEQQPSVHISDDLQHKRQADMVYSAAVDYQPGLFWAHFEHQSTPDPNMPLRILNYQTGLLLNYLRINKCSKAPLLFSLIFYHGNPSPYPHSLDWQDCFAEPELAKRYGLKSRLIDIGQISDEAIRAASPEVAGAELAFKHIFARDFTPHMDRVLIALKSAPSEIRAITLNYLACRANVPPKRLLDASLLYLPESEDTIMQMYQKNQQAYIEKGRLEGIEEGKAEGKAEGKVEGIEEGIERGKLAALKQVATHMFSRGDSLAAVQTTTGLPTATLETLEEAEEESTA